MADLPRGTFSDPWKTAVLMDLPGGKIPGYLGDPLEGEGNTLFYTFTSSACHLDTRVSYGVAPGGRKIPWFNILQNTVIHDALASYVPTAL